MPATVAEVVWYNEDSTSPLTVSKPAGFTTGDILLAVLVQHAPSSQLGDMTAPSGWTEQGSYSEAQNQGKVYTIEYSVGLPSTWDFPYYVNADVCLALFRISGANVPVTLVIGSSTFSSLASADDSPSITPTDADDLLLCLIANICTDNAFSATDPVDMTDQGQTQAASTYMALAAASEQLVSSSATGVRQWKSVTPTGFNGATLSIAVDSATVVEGGAASDTAGLSPELPPWLLLLLAARNQEQWLASAGTYLQDLTDDAGLSDATAFAIASASTDDAGLTDGQVRELGRPAADSAGLTDATGFDAAYTRTDSAGLTDTATLLMVKPVDVTDSVGLTDAKTLAIALARTDSAGLTDTAGFAQGYVYTDSVGLTDAVSIAQIFPVTVTDDAGLTDDATLQAGKLVVATDSAGLSDARILVIGLERTDSAGLTDALMLSPALGRTDDAGLTDTTSLGVGTARTDDAGLSDAATVDRVRVGDVTDSVGLSDGFTIQTGTSTFFLPSGLVPVRTYSQAELLSGNRLTRFRFDLHSRTEAPLGVLDGVTKGHVDFTSSASVHSGGALEIVDTGQSVDWLNDRVRPVVIIEGLDEIPLGMFVFSEAPQEWGDTGRVWQVKLLDKTSILDQDKVDATYSLPAGTSVETAARALIASTGETNIALTPCPETLAGPLSWPAGTSKLRIVNDLFSTCNYFSLYADASGQLRGQTYVKPANRPIRYEFLDGQQSIYSPNFVVDVDLFSIPNKFVAVGQGDASTEALVGVATNEDPNSPYSFDNRGRWIVATATGVEAADQDMLDAYALRRLIELTSPTSSIDVNHAMVPDLTFNDAVRLRRVPAGVDARHVVTKMVVSFDPTALVKSTLQEVVDL